MTLFELGISFAETASHCSLLQYHWKSKGRHAFTSCSYCVTCIIPVKATVWFYSSTGFKHSLICPRGILTNSQSTSSIIRHHSQNSIHLSRPSSFSKTY